MNIKTGGFRFRSLLVFLIIAVAAPLLAQKLSDTELFTRGQAAYLSGQFGDAAMYLFAYIDRNPASMQNNTTHAQQVREALKFSADQVAAALTRRSEPVQQAQGNVHAGAFGLTLAPPPLDAPGASTQPTYPLVCRGGGEMRFGWQPSAFGVDGSMLIVHFDRAAQAATDPSALAPGQCSWKDRAISADEPEQICHSVEPGKFGIWWGADGRTYGILSEAPAYVHSLASADRFAVFSVYNNGKQCLVVTRFE